MGFRESGLLVSGYAFANEWLDATTLTWRPPRKRIARDQPRWRRAA
jgi:hypothetical protein